MIAVCVTFDIKPGQMEGFLPLMRAQASNSVRDEEGCHAFDVCTQSDVADRVFLYEIYADRAAFDVHLASAHFKAFDAAVVDMVAAKDVSIFGEVTRGAN